MKLIYSKSTGMIFNVLPDNQPMEGYYIHHREDFKQDLAFINVEIYPDNLNKYKVVNNELVEYTQIELDEIQIFGRMLSIEERLLDRLEPSYEEIKKVEETLRFLELLQEVI